MEQPKKPSFFSHGFGLALLFMIIQSVSGGCAGSSDFVTGMVIGWGAFFGFLAYCVWKKDWAAFWWLVGSWLAMFACAGTLYLVVVLSVWKSMP